MKVSVLQVDRCKPILGLNAFDHAPVRQHLERELVQSPVQDSQIRDWPKATTFLGYDEVRAVKPLPHLGWRDRLDCILCQEDSNLLAQDRGVPDCHRRLENAVELGRSRKRALSTFFISARLSQRWHSWTTMVDIAFPRDRAVTFVARRAKSVAVRSSCINPGSVLPSCTCLSALVW